MYLHNLLFWLWNVRYFVFLVLGVLGTPKGSHWYGLLNQNEDTFDFNEPLLDFSSLVLFNFSLDSGNYKYMVVDTASDFRMQTID